ncbi:hypothetical protein NM688_g6805 [Phlebia brevispora]|uniref:Uncharacterized protein n=1 Tax=Phlebia brevispora TaxID=194682 RepID=A0ACC1SCC4_9APHY|nr:hypothetical protein NM688_g6805 [Phlebia brevispora]
MSVSASLPFFHYAQITRFTTLAAAVLLVYEHVLKFPHELEFFWKKKWSSGTSLFLWSRYFPLVFNVSNVCVWMLPRPSAKPYPLLGFIFFHWHTAGLAIILLTVHAILMLRIYAMYHSSRIIASLCMILLLVEMASFIVFFGIRRKGEIYSTNNPAPGVYICAAGDLKGAHWIAYQFTVLIGIESILVALAAYKRWVHRGRYGGSIMKALTTGSMIYFAIILAVLAVNQIIWLMNLVVLDEASACVTHAISPVLANRLMVAVCKHCHRHDDEESTHDASGVRFTPGATTVTAVEQRSDTGFDMEDDVDERPADCAYEMCTFETA